MTLFLPVRAPYDWAGIRAFLAARAIPGVESADPTGPYARTILIAGRPGRVTVVPEGDALRATVEGVAPVDLPEVEARLRRQFDCDADPAAIGAGLSRDPHLARLVAARPGLRLPGAWDPFETGCRAILGQQVSVAAARMLAGRLAAAFGAPFPGPGDAAPDRLFPTPEALVEADVAQALAMPRARGAAVRALAAAVLADPDLFAPGDGLDAAVARFVAIPGIGPWTAQYIAMRALKLPDALAVGDVGLLRALDCGAGRPSPADLVARAEAWRPWRAYAAQHLWAADEARGRPRPTKSGIRRTKVSE
ncbi:DNA-3-methyladenine glycosylase family protein [Methylobacterium aerolatum]|uniref:DNA-3-methyladenine glycosylase II n=1 Tax=Methylobacterium aerolatum TaxID=418708 RepID=A0ABU0I227_9HYPH|nr:DNA-3-methyladenine glycosylase II [Methylobacterium aerolatum]